MAQTPLSYGRQAPASTSSVTRNLLAKVRSSFSLKSRALSDFYIEPDQPHRTYSSGDLVKGVVILKALKPIRITHLVVCLHGSAQVFKNGLLERWTNSSPKVAKNPTEQQPDGFKWLFQDEVVLSSEGRLEAGIYEFHFELEFPKKELPSSIDFGRGMISYTITSTLTRPTTVNPTTSCDHKLQFNGTIDIGSIDKPKPRLITLEPIKRCSKSKVTSKQETSPQIDSAKPEDNATNLRARRKRELSLSSGPSETGTESTVSESSGSIQSGSVPSFSGQSQGQTGKVKKTITATVELLRGGCLPGDLLSLKITIDHKKPIKSLQGVIVTLYREGRLESNNVCGCNYPTCEICSSRNEKDADQKSKVKFTQLSPCSAGSTVTYRKDLSQACSPLIVDPQTLTAVVRCSIRMPEDVFPTISSVPGSLFSFRYYVEVVLDLNGKLAGQNRFLSHLKIQTSSSIDSRGCNTLSNKSGRADDLQPMWDGSLIDTVRLRHEKTVVACLFEIVVGTVNSGRIYNRRVEISKDDHGQPDFVKESTAVDTAGMRNTEPSVDGPPDIQEHDEYHGHYYSAQNAVHELQVPIPIPPPEVSEEVDEKTRLRQAEERLLPSRPPQQEVGLQEGSGFAGSSAPTLCGNGPIVSDSANWGSPQHFEPSAPLIDAVMQATVGNTGSSAEQRNGLESVLAGHPTSAAMTEDKQELERQRLLAEASAPDGHPEDADFEGEDPEVGPSVISVPLFPSAPVIPSEEYGGFGQGHFNSEVSFEHDLHNSEGLPRYER